MSFHNKHIYSLYSWDTWEYCWFGTFLLGYRLKYWKNWNVALMMKSQGSSKVPIGSRSYCNHGDKPQYHKLCNMYRSKHTCPVEQFPYVSLKQLISPSVLSGDFWLWHLKNKIILKLKSHIFCLLILLKCFVRNTRLFKKQMHNVMKKTNKH